jgi:hypothetical protein
VFTPFVHTFRAGIVSSLFLSISLATLGAVALRLSARFADGIATTGGGKWWTEGVRLGGGVR